MKSHSQIHILNHHKWQTYEMPTMKVIYGIKNSLNLVYTWSLEWSKYVNAKTRKFKLQKEQKKEITSVKEEKITWDLQLVISGPEEFPLVNL